MKKLCFFALLSLVVAAGCSKDDYLDSNSDITGDFDPLFAQELQKRGYVADAKHITPAEVEGITELDVSGTYDVRGELTSLRGIEYFESLTELRCYYNQLTLLDVSKNPALERLECNSNRLISLDVSNNLTLEYLSCDNNEFKSLDVSKNPALLVLRCGDNNQLTSLDVSKNMKLEKLACEKNPGDGAVFSVMAWFDNANIPNNFTIGSWWYNEKGVRIDYRKAE